MSADHWRRCAKMLLNYKSIRRGPRARSFIITPKQRHARTHAHALSYVARARVSGRVRHARNLMRRRSRTLHQWAVKPPTENHQAATTGTHTRTRTIRVNHIRLISAAMEIGRTLPISRGSISACVAHAYAYTKHNAHTACASVRVYSFSINCRACGSDPR